MSTLTDEQRAALQAVFADELENGWLPSEHLPCSMPARKIASSPVKDIVERLRAHGVQDAVIAADTIEQLRSELQILKRDFAVQCEFTEDERRLKQLAIAAWNTRAAPKWSSDVPTVAGYYWHGWHSGEGFGKTIFQVKIPATSGKPELVAIVDGDYVSLEDEFFRPGLWSGPLTPPGEQDDR